MNNENNTPEKAGADDTSKVFLTTDSSLQSPGEAETDKGSTDYYEVDNPKKDVSTTIGDGEMHNEGMVGEGNLPEENPFSAGHSGDEQDTAELRDSQ